jgi:GAF domain-containing protein
LYLTPYGDIKLIERERLRTVLIAPLWAEGQLTGVLNIYSRDEPRLFTVYEQELAQVFANQAAIAVQNAQFYVGAKSRAQQLHDVLAAGQNITALRPIRDVLQAITDSLVSNFGYDAVTLFPYQAEETTFEPPVISGHLRYPKIVLRKVAGDNLVEKRLTGPEFYFTPNTPDDPLLSGKFSEREGIQASGYVRLTVGGEVVGILFVNYRQAHRFSEDEQRAVRLFANQAAMAIHNTRQFAALQSQLGQLEMALAAGQGMMMRRPLRETLQTILEQLVRGEGYDIARLILYRPVRGAFGYTLVAGQLRNYAKVVGQLHEGSVVERRLVEGPDEYFTSDAPHDPLVAGSFVNREGIQAIGSIRLRDNGQTVGLLLVNKRDPHQFTTRERETLRLYAGQIEVAFHEARLFYREQERIEMLGRIGQQVGQTLDLATVLETLYAELRIVFGADVIPDVLLFDEAKQELYVPFPERFGLSVDVVGRAGQTTFKPGEGICGWVAAHKQPLNVPDVQAEPRYLQFLQTTRSELAVPILLGERLVGVLDIESPMPAKFSEDEQRLLEAVANQVAVAIRNAEQYAVLVENQQQLRALYEAGRAIVRAGLELETVLQTILDQAVMVTQANFGTIHLLRGDTLEFVAAWPPERLEWLKREIGPMRLDGPGITPRAVRENQAQLVADVFQDPDFVDATGQTRSELAVVFRRGGQREGGPVGVLNVEHREVNGFTREDRALLIALSNLAVVAIYYAEQYKELEEIRDDALATEAVAWLGLSAADWQHTINQKTFSIGVYTEALRRWLARNQTPPDLASVVLETLEGIEKVIDSIRTVPFIDRGPAETPGEIEGETLIDLELQKTVTRWCSDREDIVQIFKPQCPGVKVKIPAQWLRVAMEKLINNALKAMPNGGQLMVSTERLGDTVHIFVEDTGYGIPEFALPYFLKVTVRRPEGSGGTGTGKGALIARFVARSYGGDLKLIHTGKDVGTKLLLTLPVLENN